MHVPKLLAAAAFATGMALSAGVGAVSITITGGSWDTDSGWQSACTASGCDLTSASLNMSWTTDAGLAQTFSLENAGDTFSLTFGAGRYSDENNMLELAETDNLGLTAYLNLSGPVAGVFGAAGTVVTATGPLSDDWNDLLVTFAPIAIPFGSGGELTIDLSDPAWTCNPGQACTYDKSQTRAITALFTLATLPVETSSFIQVFAVPEPATVALMSLGLLGLGFNRRKRLLSE